MVAVPRKPTILEMYGCAHYFARSMSAMWGAAVKIKIFQPQQLPGDGVGSFPRRAFAEEPRIQQLLKAASGLDAN